MTPPHLGSTLDEVTQGLEIRTATTGLEISQLREALKTQHYLGAERPAGHVLWQGVYQTSTEEGMPSLCAVLCWASCPSSSMARSTPPSITTATTLRVSAHSALNPPLSAAFDHYRDYREKSLKLIKNAPPFPE